MRKAVIGTVASPNLILAAFAGAAIYKLIRRRKSASPPLDEVARNQEREFVLGLTAYWHFLAAVFFTLKSRAIIKRFTYERPISPVSKAFIVALGGLNIPIVLLAINGFKTSSTVLRKKIMFLLALANFSQFVADIQAHREGVVNYDFFVSITVPDFIFSLVNYYYSK